MVRIVEQIRSGDLGFTLKFLVDMDDVVEVEDDPFERGVTMDHGRLVGIECESRDGVRRKVLVRTINKKDGRDQDEDLVFDNDVRTTRELFNPRAVRMSSLNLRHSVVVVGGD